MTSLPLFDGQLVLVTGAGSGIGEAVAIGLARWGARVVATDIDGASAARTAAAIEAAGHFALSYSLDVTDLPACRAVAAEVRAAAGPVSVLVNNAGISRRGAIDDDDARAAWDDSLAVNVTGGFNVVLAFLDQLRAMTGNIVNITSVCGMITARTFPGYNASKAAAIGMTRSLAQKLAPEGIRVNAILPGAVATPMTAGMRANSETSAYFLGRTPMGRFGEPKEFVGPVAFLASDMARFVTGALLAVDGGLLAE